MTAQTRRPAPHTAAPLMHALRESVQLWSDHTLCLKEGRKEERLPRFDWLAHHTQPHAMALGCPAARDASGWRIVLEGGIMMFFGVFYGVSSATLSYAFAGKSGWILLLFSGLLVLWV